MSAKQGKKMFKSPADKKRSNGQKSMTRAPKPRRNNVARSSHTQSVVTKVLHSEGGHGTDLRSSSADFDRKQMVVPTQDSIVVTPNMDFACLRSLALGYVLEALRRGWRGANGSPYYAARYLYDSFKSVCRGTFPTIQSASYVFWVVCDALYPKQCRFKTGSIQYSWALVGNDTFDPVTVMDGVILVFGTPSVFEINGLSILSLPVPYTEDAGAAALASLFQFFGDDLWNQKRSLSAGETAAGKDVSAFAAVYAEIGSVYSCPGGIATTLQTETVIRSPVFSQFALYQATQIWRGFQEYRKNSGSPMSIFPRIMSLHTQKDLTNKVSPIFKFCDFDEIFETLSLTVGSALEVATATNLGTVPLICPLTSQQVQILLRQCVLQVFKNGMGNDIRYNSNNALDFYPFSVATNGVDYTVCGVTGMLLPQLLAENIRAFGRQLKKDSFGGIHDIIPIVGRYVTPQLQNYNWNLPDGSPLPVYSVDPVEVPIDLVSATAIDPSNSQLVYLDLNGSQIEGWMTQWNGFMQKLSSNLTPLTNPGGELKINALDVLCFTQHSSIVEIPLNLNETASASAPGTTTAASSDKSVSSKRKSSSRPVAQGTPKIKLGANVSPDANSTFYTNVCCLSTSCTYPINETSWNFLKVMIKPSYIGESGLAFEGTVPAQQVFQCEPKLLVHVPETSGGLLIGGGFSRTFLYDQHLQMAKLDVRAGLAENGTEQSRALDALIAQGRGGWFTSVAGSFLEAVGVKGAKQVANTIGEITGL